MVKSGKATFVNTLLAADQFTDLLRIKEHYGIAARSDTIRFLIRQEIRRLDSEKSENPVSGSPITAKS